MSGNRSRIVFVSGCETRHRPDWMVSSRSKLNLISIGAQWGLVICLSAGCSIEVAQICLSAERKDSIADVMTKRLGCL